MHLNSSCWVSTRAYHNLLGLKDFDVVVVECLEEAGAMQMNHYSNGRTHAN
jgi:hypothetical protein